MYARCTLFDVLCLTYAPPSIVVQHHLLYGSAPIAIKMIVRRTNIDHFRKQNKSGLVKSGAREPGATS